MDKVLKKKKQRAYKRWQVHQRPWWPKAKKLTVSPKETRLSSYGQGPKKKKKKGPTKDDKFIKALDGLKLKSWQSHQKRWDYRHMDKVLKNQRAYKKWQVHQWTWRTETQKLMVHTKTDLLTAYKKITRSSLPVRLSEEADGRNRRLGSTTRLTALEKWRTRLYWRSFPVSKLTGFPNKRECLLRPWKSTD